MKKSVEIAKNNNLCISCGICKNVCNKSCITYKRQNGLFLPIIDNDKCVNCGLCTKVCPGLNMNFINSNPLYAVYGEIKACYNAWSKNDRCRYVSASGGVVSSIISKLLTENVYDSAFVLDTYDYNSQLITKRITKKDIENEHFFEKVPKSRYLPVSHENLISYIKDNRNERIIVVGTSCALQGINKAINLLNLDRKNYFLIGLFCDKVYNYNIYQYYNDNFAGEKKLTSLHFKNKESGEWPGNMKLFFEDGTSEYLDKSERIKTKDYFMPERCLYCIDKLNVSADISVGDNYTNICSSKKGSNSVIIRTATGELIWKSIFDVVEYCSVSIKDICKSQYIDERINNLYFANLKQRKYNKSGHPINIISGVDCNNNAYDFEYAWKTKLFGLAFGKEYGSNKIKFKNRSIEKSQNNKRILYYYYAIKSKFIRGKVVLCQRLKKFKCTGMKY